MPQDLRAPILRNVDLGHGHFLVELPAEGIARDMRPAQFFMIGIPGGEILLRRPFSVCGLPGTFDDASPDSVQVLFRVVGRGTALLATLERGATLTVLGPLGHGFAPPADGVQPVFVAGGIGCAPFPAWAASLAGLAPRPRMLYGARSAGDLPLRAWFEERTDLMVTTEDGSAGRRGLVTEPLAELLLAADPRALQLYACGPEGMLRAVARLALERGVPCELSLEAHMACGFGVCLGCVVPTRRDAAAALQYERVCVEGPVMSAEVLAW